MVDGSGMVKENNDNVQIFIWPQEKNLQWL